MRFLQSREFTSVSDRRSVDPRPSVRGCRRPWPASLGLRRNAAARKHYSASACAPPTEVAKLPVTRSRRVASSPPPQANGFCRVLLRVGHMCTRREKQDVYPTSAGHASWTTRIGLRMVILRSPVAMPFRRTAEAVAQRTIGLAEHGLRWDGRELPGRTLWALAVALASSPKC